ncbi:hypothetical protein NE237_026032 [Protea cynaroides]|uniref:Uncharacterized protein n=1 Tax=Protea cynaroides TaxID=273540 RepID=A0A9Q0K0S8_9MAGN|nr:hypothetical protein NE237_026032 [Protea cynaroides]
MGVYVEGKIEGMEVAVLSYNSDSLKGSNATLVESETLSTEVTMKEQLTTLSDLEPQSISREDVMQLPREDASTVEEKMAVASQSLKAVFLNDSENGKPSLAGERQEESEPGKETSRKLFAAAPPFNPSMVAVFGSVPMPGFKDHDGILPLPINVPPMLNVNPVRKSHQSAMAFVPYGPRLSGGYNRSGNQVLRHKHCFQNAEHAGDGNHFNPPIIMNPHAIEFIPGQLWVLNSLPAYSLAVPVHTNGYPSSPDGALVPYNCFPASPNSIPKSLNGFLVSPNFSLESSTVEVVENKDKIGTDEDAEKPSWNGRREKTYKMRKTSKSNHL